MAQIRIISNPYNREIAYEIYNEGQDTWENIRVHNPNSKLRNDETGRAFLPFKIKEIIDLIVDEYYNSDAPVSLLFEGTLDEYNEVAAVCQHPEIAGKINLTRAGKILENARIISTPTKEVFSKVKPIIEKIIKDDRTVTKKLGKVSDALKDIIPICVFGNYSAGKSTFINALIGSEILPSGGDPVTAKIYRIERSQNEDIARIRFRLLSEAYEILFEGNAYRLLKGNPENEVMQELHQVVAGLKNPTMAVLINRTLELLNGYEKKDRTSTEISNVISMEVPFSKSGLLGRSYNNFVIFDTPGSNSSSNLEHSAVLEEALEGFSNGIPVWVSTYESLDSTDNASLCERILNIQALDKRFTMIVLNKADGSDLEQEGFADSKEREILEYDSVEKMYAGGIYFVSSIMGLGAKNDGKLVDNHYRRIYRSQQEMYANPEDEDYATLYQYNIMPAQIKESMVQRIQEAMDTKGDSMPEAFLIYVNSGLYCIEQEIDVFASKYAAYNKCQMVFLFLSEVIQETKTRIMNRTDSLKRTREARRRELEAAKAKLIDEVSQKARDVSEEFEKASKQYVKELTAMQSDFIYTEEALHEMTDTVHFTNLERSDHHRQKEAYEASKSGMLTRMRENAQGLLSRKDVVESLRAMKDDFVSDFDAVRKSRASMEQENRDVDKRTSDDILDTVVKKYKESVNQVMTRLNGAITEHWMNRARSLRNMMISIITGSDALTSTQRDEVSRIIMNYEELQFNDDTDSVFIKSRFLSGMILGIRFSDSEKLNIKRLATIYNDKMRKTINEMAYMINGSCMQSYKNWMENLAMLIEENITEYNPQLRDMSDMIREETEKIMELEDNQNQISEALESIRALMAWKPLA